MKNGTDRESNMANCIIATPKGSLMMKNNRIIKCKFLILLCSDLT